MTVLSGLITYSVGKKAILSISLKLSESIMLYVIPSVQSPKDEGTVLEPATA